MRLWGRDGSWFRRREEGDKISVRKGWGGRKA
jgi:hypothetical protein